MRHLVLVVAVASVSASCCCRRPCRPAPPAAPPIAAVAPRAPAPTPQLRNALDEQIGEQLLAKRVMNLSWADDTTLAAAVAYLRTITGLNFFITPRAHLEMESKTVPLAVDNVPVSTILEIITETHGLAWEVRDGLVWIGTRDELSGRLVLRFYDEGDLVADSAADAFARTTPSNVDTLVLSVRSRIGPATLSQEGVHVEQKRGILIVRAPPASHADIESYLDGLRRQAGAR